MNKSSKLVDINANKVNRKSKFGVIIIDDIHYTLKIKYKYIKLKIGGNLMEIKKFNKKSIPDIPFNLDFINKDKK